MTIERIKRRMSVRLVLLAVLGSMTGLVGLLAPAAGAKASVSHAGALELLDHRRKQGRVAATVLS